VKGINPDAIVRERPAGIPSDGGGEAALAFAIRGSKKGLPEPVTQFHFAWCCEHLKAVHNRRIDKIAAGHPTYTVCGECRAEERHWVHEYSHERDFRFDFAWPSQCLAVEVDGGTYSGGRHTRGDGYAEDCEKQNEAVIRGWKVMRVTTAQVDSGQALEWIERALT
jgi:hypothetical protein